MRINIEITANGFTTDTTIDTDRESTVYPEELAARARQALDAALHPHLAAHAAEVAAAEGELAPSEDQKGAF